MYIKLLLYQIDVYYPIFVFQIYMNIFENGNASYRHPVSFWFYFSFCRFACSSPEYSCRYLNEWNRRVQASQKRVREISFLKHCTAQPAYKDFPSEVWGRHLWIFPMLDSFHRQAVFYAAAVTAHLAKSYGSLFLKIFNLVLVRLG